MLLAVEGGGFFSSSASGYSKGLTLLLLGQSNEEKPMRVSPWNQYHLVDHKSNPDLQLASTKDRLVRGCASFVCFGHGAAGLENPSPLKVGPTHQQDTLPESTVSNKEHGHTCHFVGNENDSRKGLKSSLKRLSSTIPVSSEVGTDCDSMYEKGIDISDNTERRKVHWTDTSGGELAEIREFELSDPDDEFDGGSGRRCLCRIM